MYKLIKIILLLAFCSQLLATEKVSLNTLENLAIGAISGTAEVCICHPLEFIKGTIQEPDKFKWPIDIPKPRKEFKKFVRTLANIQNLKVLHKTLYRGWSACAASYVPGYASQFLISEKLKELLLDKEQSNNELKKIPLDFLAGALSAGIITPSQVVTIYQQRDNKKLIEACKEIYSKNKLKGFYRGFIPTALRWGGFAGIYLSGSDIVKNKLKEFHGKDLYKDLSGEALAKTDIGYSILAGIPTGILATIITHPFDVVKTRIQLDYQATKYNNLREVISELYQENGIKSFTKGWAPRSGRVIAAIIILNGLNKSLKCKLLKYKEDQL